MNKQKGTLLLATLVLIAATGGLLAYCHAHQKLGLPGVKTHPLASSNRLQVDLPERVLDYISEERGPDEVTLGTLPQDTSFGTRIYQGPDKFWISMNVVLMGTDRTSMHKPQICLEGQGWHIDAGKSTEETVHIERPCSYELPVVKLICAREATVDGKTTTISGIYVYWFVADDATSASVSGIDRVAKLASKMLRTGVLQRWAYVSCLAACAPGQEDATFERMKKFIAASAPEFQLYPRPPVGTPSAQR